MRISRVMGPCLTWVLLLVGGCGDDSMEDGAANDVHGDHDAGDGDGDMAFPFVPCEEGITFSIGMEAEGEDGLVTARLVDASPAPPEKFINDWTVEFVDADGNTLGDAEIDMARPFMPAHGHDGTFPPVIEAADSPGTFEIADLNMWMRGQWQVQIDVSSASAGDDYIVFDVCIEE